MASNLADLLQQLILPNNIQRHAAEQQFHALIREQCEATLIALFQVTNNPGVIVSLRKLAAVLLRRNLIDSEESAYFKLSPNSQSTLLAELIRVLRDEPDDSIRLLISEIAGELGGSILDPADWPALPHAALGLCKSAAVGDRMIGLSLLGYLAECQLTSGSAEAFLHESLAILQANFMPPYQMHENLVVGNVKALNALLQSVRSASQTDRLQVLIPVLMETFLAIVKAKVMELDADEELDDDDTVKLFLEELIDIADQNTAFFSLATYNSYIPALLTALNDLHIVLSVNMKSLFIEFLVTLAVGNPKAMKKYRGPANEKSYFLSTFLPYLIELMTHFELDENWDKEISIEEMSNSDIHSVAEGALVRVMGAFAPSTLHNIIMSAVAEHLNTQEDAECHIIASLQVLAGYMEISHSLTANLQKHQEEVMQLLSLHIASPIPRIRYAAYYALGQFLVYHMEHLSADVLVAILQTCLSQVPSCTSARVLRSLLLALVNLFQVADGSIWRREHIEQALQVMQLLPGSANIAQEIILTLVITLLEVTRSYPIHAIWKEAYSTLMPLLRAVLHSYTTQAYGAGMHSTQVNIYSNLLEAMSMLGEAAGMDLFVNDAREIMMMIQKEKEDDLGGVKAVVRIARCLGADFAPYLSLTMQKVAVCLSQDIAVADGNADEEDRDVEMIDSKDGLLAVRTSLIEEQITALQCIYFILDNDSMWEAYVPFYEYTVDLVRKGIQSPHEDIRSHILILLPLLVKYIIAYHGKYSQGALAHIRMEEVLSNALTACNSVLENEGNTELVITSLQVLKQIVSCKGAVLHTDQLVMLAQALKMVLRDSLQRRAVLKAEAAITSNFADAEPDAEENVEDIDEAELLAAQSAELNYHLSEVLSALLQTNGFFPIYWEQWHDLVLTLAHVYCLKEDRRLAMLITCDVMQYSPACEEYLLAIFPVLMAILESEGDWDSQRAACYALCCMFDQHSARIVGHPAMTVAWMHRALAALRTCTIRCHAYDEQSEAKGCCLDNAIAAVGVILEQSLMPFNLPLPFDQLFQQYLLSWPLRYDVEEAEKCVFRLHRMLSQHAQTMWGCFQLHPAALVLCVKAVVQTSVLLSESMLEEGRRHCQAVLVELCKAEMREFIWKGLEAAERDALQQILKEAGQA